VRYCNPVHDLVALVHHMPVCTA